MSYTVLATNSSTIALSYGQSFVGEWVNALAYSSLQIAVISDLSGSLFIDSSLDGSVVAATETHAYAGGSVDLTVRYTITRNYVRVRFTNTQQIHVHQTSFSLQTLASGTLLPESTLDESLSESTSASVVRSIVAGQIATGDFQNAAVTPDLDNRGALNVSFGDAAVSDSFGRFRVSNPITIFDSKLIEDAAPLFWDDSQVSGGGTGTSHSTATASVTLSVGASTAGRRLRQTFQSFNYQPGKSFLILMTGVLDKSGGGTGITRRIGYYDDGNGLYFEDLAGAVSVVRRTSVTGSPVNNSVAQADWNIDPMDGTGPSGVTIDWTKTQIFLIDMEWLGVGRVRFALVIQGHIFYVHQMAHANVLTEVYMSTPNLPLRYEIINDGTGVASSIQQICSSVIVEGGNDLTGIVRSASTNGTHVDANIADTIYAVLGIQKKTGYKTQIQVIRMYLVSETADSFEWLLYLNPTVAGSFTYGAETNSAAEIARGATANTVTGGTLLQSGWSTSSAAAVAALESTTRLGTSIAGTRDTLVLAVRPLSGNADIQGSITWREGI